MIDEKKLIKAFDENNMFLPEVVEKLINNQPKIDQWITGRNPTKEECGKYGSREFQVTVVSPITGDAETLVMYFCYDTMRGKEIGRWKWHGGISPQEVIAWKPLSEPYKQAED